MQQQIKISPAVIQSGVAVRCSKCGKDIFENLIKVIKIAKLLPENKTGVDLIIDQPVKRCVSCKHVLKPGDLQGGNGAAPKHG